MTDSPSSLAAEAYVYGFPLVFNLDQINRYVHEGVGANPATPFNSLSHARTLAGPEDTFVTINNDTVYSMGPLDLSGGPLLLHVPDTGDRYYVLQFVDAWTNNFAYIGQRATGTAAGDFVLVPPEWDGGDVPEGAPATATIIRVPTTVAVIVGRWACDGEADLTAVHALQDATTLTPLVSEIKGTGIAVPDPAVPEDLLFLEKLRLWSQQFPPAPRDRELQSSWGSIGIGKSGASPYIGLDDTQHVSLAAGLAEGSATLANILTHGSSPEVNGWKLTFHVFDYNLDYFELGALDDPRFILSGPPEVRIAERAGAALGGLWGNHAYEAAYIMTYLDDRGDQLTGDHRYVLELPSTPPVKAFWSLTMYSVPDFFLVANPINRYSIGDRTPGIVTGKDGTLSITISVDEPADPAARANWLPAPAGEFRPVLRMYIPENAVLTGDYAVPAIRRID